MKKITLVALVLGTLLPFTASAQLSGLLEGQEVVKSQTFNPTIQSLVNYSLGKKTGLYMFAQTGSTWRQVYVGTTYSPRPWVQVGVGYGVERADDTQRIGSFAYFGKGSASLLVIYEDGGTGPWHKVVANYALTNWGVGVMDQAGLGTGPRIVRSIGKHYQVWGAYLANGGKFTPTFAISRSF